MKAFSLYENWAFHEENPYAEPLHVDAESRILRFTLRPHQEVREHNAPHSPVQIVVLRGRGLFSGEDGVEHEHGEGNLIVFASGEKHRIRALDANLVFVAFLHGAPSTK